MIFKRYLSLLTVLDKLLILILFTFSMICILKFNKNRGEKEVIISLNENIIGVYPLNKDTILTINEHCTAEIKDNKVRMLHSDCPDKRCVKQGYSNKMPIICLPNKVVLDFTKDKTSKKIHILY